MPAFYYIFILDVFFLYSGGTPGANDYLSNYSFISYFSNKILIISSIIFFYLIPFILSKKENIINIELNKYFSRKDLGMFNTLYLYFLSEESFVRHRDTMMGTHGVQRIHRCHSARVRGRAYARYMRIRRAE